MKSVLELIQKFIPLIVGFPPWVQVFFFAVILQILLLMFVMFFYSVYPRSSKESTKVNGAKDRTAIIIEKESTSTAPEGVTEVNLDALAKSNDPNVALSLANLATSYEALGKYKQAEEIWRKVVSINEAAYGIQHPAYAESLQSLARLNTETGKYQEALRLQSKAVQVFELSYGPEHPKIATSLNRLAAIHLKLANFSEAAPLIERALRIRESSLGADHPELIEIYENLLALYSQAGDYSKVEAVKLRLEELKAKFSNR